MNLVFSRDPFWFSPEYVLLEFENLVKSSEIIPGTKSFRKASEAFVSAVSLVGVRKIIGRDFWLQIVPDTEESPDVRTGCYDRKIRENDFSIQDVEIVTFDAHSSDTIPEFLARTKFAKGKSYDPLTTILCHIDKQISLPPLPTLRDSLTRAGICSGSPILLIGKNHPTEPRFKLVQISPDIGFEINFDLREERSKWKTPPRLKIFRGSKAITFQTADSPGPFDGLL